MNLTIFDNLDSNFTLKHNLGAIHDKIICANLSRVHFTKNYFTFHDFFSFGIFVSFREKVVIILPLSFIGAENFRIVGTVKYLKCNQPECQLKKRNDQSEAEKL